MKFYFDDIYCYSMYDFEPEIEVKMKLTAETAGDCAIFDKLLNAPSLPHMQETLAKILSDRPASGSSLPTIKNVYFNDPVTVVLWDDGTKTIVRCQKGDTYSKETGLSLCIAKKAMGNKSNFNDIFKKWIPEEKPVRGFRSKLNLDEWDKVGNTYSDKLYQLTKEACAPKVERSCATCKFVHNPGYSYIEPCYSCDLSYSEWTPVR